MSKRFLLPHVSADDFAAILVALFQHGEKDLGISIATGAAQFNPDEDSDPNATLAIPTLNPLQERAQRHDARTRAL